VSIAPHRKLILQALKSSMGDNFERASYAFGHYTDTQMDAPYGQSGSTPRRILADYLSHKRSVQAAIDYVKEAP
jgi:hypothetical protein